MYMNVHEAKSSLSRLLALVEAGEDVVIGRAGQPVARLVPVQPPAEPRRPGRWAGRVHLADDFDVLPEEVAAALRGERP